MSSNRTSYWRELRLVDRDSHLTFAKKTKISRSAGFCFCRIQNFTISEDSATGQCERAFNKLARTFAAQVETLKRYGAAVSKRCSAASRRSAADRGQRAEAAMQALSGKAIARCQAKRSSPLRLLAAR